MDSIPSEAPLTSLDSPDSTMAKMTLNSLSTLSIAITNTKPDEVLDTPTSTSDTRDEAAEAASEVVLSSTFDETTGNLLEFEVFPSLPTRLRLKIWRSTIEPRLVLATQWSGNLITTPSKKPSIFLVCHESRIVALEEHQVLGRSPYPIYFSPALDTIYWREGSLLEHASTNPCFKEAACHIQTLAIHAHWPFGSNFFPPEKIFDYFRLCFDILQDLQELVVVREQGLVEDVRTPQSSLRHVLPPVHNNIRKLSPITAESDFQTEIFKSEYVQRDFSSYLKRHFTRLGGSSCRTVPVVRFLREDDVGESIDEWPSKQGGFKENGEECCEVGR